MFSAIFILVSLCTQMLGTPVIQAQGSKAEILDITNQLDHSAWSQEVGKADPAQSQTNPVKSQEDRKADPVQSQEDRKADPVQSQKDKKADPVQSPKEASVDPVQSQEDGKADPVQSQGDRKADPVQSPKDASVDPLQSQEDGKAEPTQSQEDGKADPVKSEENGKADPIQSQEEGNDKDYKEEIDNILDAVYATVLGDTAAAAVTMTAVIPDVTASTAATDVDREDAGYDYYYWDQVSDVFPENLFPEGWTEGVIKFFTEPSSPFNYALSYNYTPVIESVKHVLEFIVSDSSPGAYIANYDYSSLFSRVKTFISTGDYRGMLDDSVTFVENSLGAEVARGLGAVLLLLLSVFLVIIFLPLMAILGSVVAAISVALLLGSDILAAKLIEEFGVPDIVSREVQNFAARGFQNAFTSYFSFPDFEVPSFLDYFK